MASEQIWHNYLTYSLWEKTRISSSEHQKVNIITSWSYKWNFHNYILSAHCVKCNIARKCSVPHGNLSRSVSCVIGAAFAAVIQLLSSSLVELLLLGFWRLLCRATLSSFFQPGSLPQYHHSICSIFCSARSVNSVNVLGYSSICHIFCL